MLGKFPNESKKYLNVQCVLKEILPFHSNFTPETQENPEMTVDGKGIHPKLILSLNNLKRILRMGTGNSENVRKHRVPPRNREQLYRASSYSYIGIFLEEPN